MSTPVNPYDLLAYPGSPRPQAHPRRLRTIAWLHGLDAPPLAEARVLELGCGDGMHLIWLATEFPGMRCLGVDLAAGGLIRGREWAATLGLAGVELRQADIAAEDPDWGEFDYVLAHGVYSWVPPAVADRLLKLCAAHLAPRGVAYLSYNTLPGGHLRRLLEEMLAFHARGATAPEDCLNRALSFGDRLLEWIDRELPEHALLALELARLRSQDPVSQYHDALAPWSRPLLFADFIAHCAGHGLKYLDEAHLPDAHRLWLDPKLAAEIADWASTREEREQYADFARLRRFRQTLLVRASADIQEDMDPNSLYTLHFSSHLTQMDRDADGVRYRDGEGTEVRVPADGVVPALDALARVWPARLGFRDLLPPGAGEAAADQLSRRLLTLLAAGMIEAERDPLHLPATTPARPRVSALARLQAVRGERLAMPRGQWLEVTDPFSRALIARLDGTRDIGALARDLAADAECNRLTPPPDLGACLGREVLAQRLDVALPHRLAELRRLGLLLA